MNLKNIEPVKFHIRALQLSGVVGFCKTAMGLGRGGEVTEDTQFVFVSSSTCDQALAFIFKTADMEK